MTPLVAAAWRHGLTNHPDRALAERIVEGIEYGADLGYRSDDTKGRLACANLVSANQHAAAVEKDLATECALGRKAGPFDEPPMPGLIVSPIGCVPKKNGKLRVIHHLSYPRGGDSVNAAVQRMQCKLTSFDRAVDMVRRAGRGAFLTKIDIDGAYRNIPAHPDCWRVLGMRWRGKLYHDRVLPFGLSSSCAIWEEFATAAEWIVQQQLGIDLMLHYIDDTLLAHPAGSVERARAVRDMVLRVFKLLGLPIAMSKLEGPVTSLVFLGIMLDTVAMTAKLDSARLAELRTLLASWTGRTTCSRKELQSLVGKLTFATRVVRPGRIFTTRMFALLAATHDRPRITLSADFALDLAWWREFMDRWNGVSLLPPAAASVIVHSDACGTGFGAHTGTRWLAGSWQAEEHALATAEDAAAESMPYLELRALTIAATTWAHEWTGARVEFRCDCMPVVHAIEKRTSPQPRIMTLIRALHHTAASHNFEFTATHISGESNTMADALSRGVMATFVQAAAAAGLDMDPSATPPRRPSAGRW